MPCAERLADRWIDRCSLVHELPVDVQRVLADHADVDVALAWDVGEVPIGALGEDLDGVFGESRARRDRGTDFAFGPLHLVLFGLARRPAPNQ